VAQVLTYIRQNFGNLEQGVSAAEVADRRAKGQWTPPTPTPAPSPAPPAPPR
jgi:hypothetical protein